MKTRSLLLPVLVGSSLVALAQNSVPPNGAVASNAAQNFNVHTSSAAEIVKMRDAGVDGSVIRSYVQTLQVPYKATADDILYLHDHKVPDDVVVEWIKKGSELVTWSAQAQSPAQTGQHGAQSPDLVNAATPAPLPVQVQQPATQQVVYQNPAPTVVYSSPSYVYSDPYWYTSPVSIGFSWGWGYPYYGGYHHGGHYYGHGGYYGGGYHGGGHYNYVSHGGGSHGGGSHGGGSWGGGGGGGMHGGGGGRGGGRH